MTARAELAAAQAALVAALVAGGAPPPGFDAVRLGRQAATLRAKRRRVVAAARPDLVVRLGERAFTAAFDAWAAAHPPRVGVCPHADAAAFAASLPRRTRRSWAMLGTAGRYSPPRAGTPWAGRVLPGRNEYDGVTTHGAAPLGRSQP